MEYFTKKNKVKRIYKFIFWIIVWLILFILVVNFYVLSFSKNGYFKEIKKLPETRIWLVFWASVRRDWRPSDILKDRLYTAYEAYKIWKIKKIIVSWDNRKVDYNEPDNMKKYLVKLWVKESDIQPDYAGFDTYSSLYRAKEIFWVKKIILFTQDFHLKRALYIGKKLGIETYWIETNNHSYLKEKYNNFREIWARIKAFFEVEIFKSKPKFLGEKIEIK
jgi:SanA protein